MGGDHGPRVTVPAALSVLAEQSNLQLILVGKRSVIEAELTQYTNLNKHHTNLNKHQDRLIIRNATQVVDMDEAPSLALRGKKDSSMRVALNLLQEGLVQACVSAGNTGALMATARFVLKMLPGIDRPAILFPLPSLQGPVHMLDLGANVECQADHLFQFAVMGAVVVSAIENKPNPKVGLLNVGKEAIKGTEQVKRASQLLSSVPSINYVGFIEGNDIYKGTVDVVVCDGFVGNVALKVSEGLAYMMLQHVRQELTKNWYTKLAALVAKPMLKSIFGRFDPNRYNGGSLLGLQGVVIKSHGGANTEAFAEAIRVAVKEVEKNVPETICDTVAVKLEGCEIA